MAGIFQALGAPDTVQCLLGPQEVGEESLILVYEPPKSHILMSTAHIF